MEHSVLQSNVVMQLQLTPLAGYSVPCNTVVMCSVAATSAGNIFLGGADGNVYQLQYGKRQMCRLSCVSRSFLTMLGAGVLPGYLSSRIWSLVPIDTIVVDNDRHFLYTLSQNHSIRVRFCKTSLVLEVAALLHVSCSFLWPTCAGR